MPPRSRYKGPRGVLESRIYLQVSCVKIDDVEAVLDVVALVNTLKIDGRWSCAAMIVDVRRNGGKDLWGRLTNINSIIPANARYGCTTSA